MGNVLVELAEQLAKKVDSEDVARNIIDGFWAQKGATRSSVQRQTRNLLNRMDADSASNLAKLNDLLEEVNGGQIAIKEARVSSGTTKGPNTASSPAPYSQTPGQLGFNIGPDGQMSFSGMHSMPNFKEGVNGQMYLDIEGVTPSAPKNTPAASTTATPYERTPGQQRLVNDKAGNTTYESKALEAQRAEEVRKANRNWRQRTVEGVSSAWKHVKTGVSDVVTGQGDAHKLIGGRKTRNAERLAANEEYARTGIGSAQTKRQFYDNYQRKPIDNSEYHYVTDPDTPLGGSIEEQLAEDITNKSFDFSGISEWAHENQLIVAGGIAGAAILLTSDDDYD